MADGRDMCAQEWLTGKILTPYDMNRKQIVNILTRLHRSRPLMTQLGRLGYAMETPVRFITVLAGKRLQMRCVKSFYPVK